MQKLEVGAGRIESILGPSQNRNRHDRFREGEITPTPRPWAEIPSVWSQNQVSCNCARNKGEKSSPKEGGHEGDDGEPQPKIVRRRRPPTKNQKKFVETSPIDHVSPEIPQVHLLLVEKIKELASTLKADMKYRKKQFTVDENRRDTYKQFHPLSSGNEPPVFSNSAGDMKRLMPNQTSVTSPSIASTSSPKTSMFS
ncbi:Uncharacterized protein Fot_25779 [Forsythia ovata]|uniref:Uncharacterized protein n=1 Tax=Forsythia ovata TaxID=205694 RepID=A0ABD1UA58_9LAMI